MAESKKKAVKTKVVDQSGKRFKARHGYVWKSGSKADPDKDRWNFTVVDPVSGNITSRGNGYDSERNAARAVQEEVGGLTLLVYGRYVAPGKKRK